MPPIITILLFIALVWVSIALGKKREECRRLKHFYRHYDENVERLLQSTDDVERILKAEIKRLKSKNVTKKRNERH